MSGYRQRRPIKFDDMKFEGHFYAGTIWPIVSTRTGEEYDVELTERGFSCSCIGFERHGKCKHITGVHDRMVEDVEF